MEPEEEQGTAQSGGDRDRDRHDESFDPDVTRPWELEHQVGPEEFDDRADGADQESADGAEGEGLVLEFRDREKFDDDRAAEIKRKDMVCLTEDVGHHKRHDATHQQEEHGGADGRATADIQSGRHQGQDRGGRDEHRLEHHTELGDAEIELGLEHREADEECAESDREGDLAQPFRHFGADLVVAEFAFALEDDDARSRQAGSADEHEVGRTPQRHVLTEDPVPDVIEREADEGIQSARRDQDAADRRVPMTSDAHRSNAGFHAITWIDDSRHTGDEQREQSAEDQVVRRVGEWSRVAAAARVQTHVPEETDERHDERRGDERLRDGYPARRAEFRAKQFAEIVEPFDPVGAVLPGHDEQYCRHDDGGDRQSDDLIEGRAARGRGFGGSCEKRHTESMAFQM